ncbi:TIGR02453 family protein [Salipiger sp. H15]|uniref:TIGR02453 family protein n=1 Tax=Alloyangia sp. H15 TaxID=3029062 RepID=A0AAU8ACF2_9RHOB
MASLIDLTAFAPQARRFLSELEAHNDRAWFSAHKQRYDTEVKRPAELMIAQLTPELEVLSGERPRPKLFRPHRDVRFSDDKLPFHTHLHAIWTLPDGRAWYFALSRDYATAGVGILTFDARQMLAWQAALMGREGEELERIIARSGARLDPAPEPATGPAQGPRAELMRRPGCVLWIDGIFDDLTPDPVATLLQCYARLQPLQDWLGKRL